jgi:hypothetical protein
MLAKIMTGLSCFDKAFLNVLVMALLHVIDLPVSFKALTDRRLLDKKSHKITYHQRADIYHNKADDIEWILCIISTLCPYAVIVDKTKEYRHQPHGIPFFLVFVAHEDRHEFSDQHTVIKDEEQG